MGKPLLFLKFGYLSSTVCMISCMMVIYLCRGVHSQPTIVHAKVGGTSSLECGSPDSKWFKNGAKINETHKVKPSGTLFLFCLELSDNGIYECSDAAINKKYHLIVDNPDNKEIFHIYHKNDGKCLGTLFGSLHLDHCALHACTQKWFRTANGQIVNANDPENNQCISVLSNNDVIIEDCSREATTQRWECHDDYLAFNDSDLNLSYDNIVHKLTLSPQTGPESRWVKYNTRDNLCSANRKAVVTPTHVVKSERETVKVICQGINFFEPTYAWLKNGIRMNRTSSTSLHIDSQVLLMPFAYAVSSGNYTCVIKDKWGTAAATTVVEVYKDPSVIRHSLNQQALSGKDVCLTCQMYSNNTNPQIIWYKEGLPISSGHPNFKINTKSQGTSKKILTELCIESLDVDDSGEYSCEVKYAKKQASAQGNVQILVAPTVYIYEIEEDVLLCNASGFPAPSLTWMKDTEYIKSNTNNENSIVISIKGMAGIFTCEASNSVDTSAASFDSKTPAKSKSSENGLNLYIIVGAVVGVILLVLVIILIICCFRRLRKKPENNNYEGVYHSVRYSSSPPQSSSTPSEYTTVDIGGPPHKSRIEFHPRTSSEPVTKHFGMKAKYQSLKPRAKGEWEIPNDCIKLNKKLGEGQFGQVWKGDILARKGSRTVAIKMLLEKSSPKDRKALIDELEFMKTMSPHPNIVGLVGCCTRSEEVMIIVEYVPGGNLKDYLLYSRGNSKDVYANLAPYSATLTSKDLLTFGYQVARGMSYLEQIKCVHRDLAARNILVGDDKTCKIADFGLARDIYAENYYRKTNGGRLPLRWMAYESIFNGITTSQSDAWSFGVVLWEIVTLGGNPYPDMNRDQVIDGLQRGYRMPKPRHCSDEVYAVMWETWQQNPDKRPTFAELTATFLRLISLQQTFINMENFGEDDYENVGSYEDTGDE